MTSILPDDPIAPLANELQQFLVNDCRVEGVNLLLRRQDDRLMIWIMAVDIGPLGLLLASLSRRAELEERGSLTRRATPGENRSRPDDWEYELIATRYPVDRSVVFSAKIYLPLRDLPEVVARLHGND